MSVGIVQRKMRGVLKTLKGELMEHGMDSVRGEGEETGDGGGGESFASSAASGSGRSEYK